MVTHIPYTLPNPEQVVKEVTLREVLYKIRTRHTLMKMRSVPECFVDEFIYVFHA